VIRRRVRPCISKVSAGATESLNQEESMNYKDLKLSETPCSNAITYLESQENAQTAWDNCQRGDWLLWWITHVEKFKQGSARHRLLVETTCACGMLSLPNAGKWREDLEKIYTGLELWCAGDDTQDLNALVSAAAWSARSAAWSAAWSAAESARSAAWSAAWSSTESEVLLQCAEIVRSHFDCPAQ
jgi:hypothetical protein